MIQGMNSQRFTVFIRAGWTLIIYAALVGAPELVQAQLQKVPPAIPRISKVNGVMVAYVISGLFLAGIVVVSFRSAHRRKP